MREVQDRRRAYWNSKGVLGALSAAQVEIRYMIHHAAHWLYQFSWFGRETLQQRTDIGFGIDKDKSPTASPAAIPFSSFTDLLQVRVHCCSCQLLLICHNLFFPIPNPLFQSSHPFLLNPSTTPLPGVCMQMNWSRREPPDPPTPRYDASNTELNWRYKDVWAKGLRFNLDQVAGSCYLDTAIEGILAAYGSEPSNAGGTFQWNRGANRRCRLAWTGLQNLLTRADGQPFSDLSIQIDVSQDTCSLDGPGTPTGARFPASMLSGKRAAYALPSIGIYIEGAIGPMAQAPMPCARAADCAPINGFTPDCVDMDTRLVSLQTTFTGKGAHPFAKFSQGSYSAGGQQCATLPDLRASLRSFIVGLSGVRSTGRGRGRSQDARFCFYNPAPRDSFSGR